MFWSDGLHLLSFACQRDPFSESVGEAEAPPVCILPRLARSSFCPSFFIFTRCISTPWIFGKTLRFGSNHECSTFCFWCPPFLEEAPKFLGKFLLFFWYFTEGVRCLLYLASQPCLIWKFTWGLRSRVFFLGWIYSIRSAKVVGKSFQSFPRDLADLPPLISLGVSALVAGLDIYPLTCRRSHILGSLWIFRKDYFSLVSMPLEVLYQPYLVVVSWQRGFQWAAYLLSDRILILAVFPHFLWVGEDKNRGNIIIA